MCTLNTFVLLFLELEEVALSNNASEDPFAAPEEFTLNNLPAFSITLELTVVLLVIG